MACVGSTLGVQPLMVPSSVSNRNKAGPELLLADTTKPEVELVTSPVGEPTVGLKNGFAPNGTVTTSGSTLPTWSYRVDTPVVLSATQNGPLGKNASPQPFFRFGSM